MSNRYAIISWEKRFFCVALGELRRRRLFFEYGSASTLQPRIFRHRAQAGFGNDHNRSVIINADNVRGFQNDLAKLNPKLHIS
jgi:hypothetical protein